MTIPTLLFLVLYWPCIRMAQVLDRIAEGKQLGSVRDETVLGLGSFTGLLYWIVYVVVGITSVW